MGPGVRRDDVERFGCAHNITCHHPRKRVIQYSRDVNDEPRSRGVLDTRFRGYDDFLWSGSVRYSIVVPAGTTLRANAVIESARDFLPSPGGQGNRIWI